MLNFITCFGFAALVLKFPRNQHARHHFNIKMEQRAFMVRQRPPPHHPVSPVINSAVVI